MADEIGRLARSGSWSVMIIYLVLLAVAVGGGRQPAWAAAAPQISLSETAHDFGKANEDRELAHTFLLHNTGNAPLEILDVHSECACTVSDYDRTIAPGGEGKITLRIKPFSLRKQFRKKTTVTTNDPTRPRVALVLTGEIQPLIDIQPSQIVRFRGDPKEPLRKEVRLVSHLAGPLEIKGVQTTIPDKIDWKLRTEEQGRVYVLEVSNKWRQPGAYGGKIDLFTSAPGRPQVVLRVFAQLMEPGAGPQTSIHHNQGPVGESGRKPAGSLEMGLLTGQVVRGPAAPVERAGQPPARPVGDARIRALGPGGEEVAAAVTDPQGYYHLNLPPGTYRIEMAPLSGREFTKDLPATVTIRPREETRLDIRVDTGMR